MDICINGEAFTTSNLSRELKDKFALQDVSIADFGPDPGTNNYVAAVNRQVARVGAMALHDILQAVSKIDSALSDKA